MSSLTATPPPSSKPRPPRTTLPVDVLIPARNEAANIAEALKTVTWASNIFVVDSQSTDGTTEIGEGNGATVVQFRYPGSGPKKANWALDNLPFANEWVFILHADERVPPALLAEIEAAITHTDKNGYYADLEYFFLGRPLKCKRPNWNIRLFRHRMGRYERLFQDDATSGDMEVHERLVLPGKLGFLRTPLLHEDKKPIRAWLDSHNRYSTWEVGMYDYLRAEPLDCSPIRLLRLDSIWRRRALKRLWVRLPPGVRPLARFVYFYAFRRGFRDGYPGFAYAALMAYYEFTIGVKSWESRHVSVASSKPSKGA